MRGIVSLGVIVVIVSAISGLGVIAVGRVRDAAHQARCQNNLKEIGLGVHNYHSTYNHFPAGTVPNPELPPDRRLSWAVHLLPYVQDSGVDYLLDRAEPWDSRYNCPPRCIRGRDDELAGDFYCFVCPANPTRNGPDLPCPLQYTGVSGPGESAAELPLADPKAGFFGYDRTLTLGDIKDGTSSTLMLAEVVDGGPWTAGGRATVRGLAGGTPYLGAGGQFAGLHPCDVFLGSRPVVTNVAFADGHVRPLTNAVSPAVFEGLATVAGGEDVGPW